MPSEDSPTIGHKFPFNACEILCSSNGLNMNKLINLKDDKISDEDSKKKSNDNEDIQDFNDKNDNNDNDDDNKEDNEQEKNDDNVQEKKEESDEKKEEGTEEKKEEGTAEKKEEGTEEKKEEEKEEKKEEGTEEKKEDGTEEKKEENSEEKKEEGTEEKKEENLDDKKEEATADKKEEEKEENLEDKKEEETEDKKEEEAEEDDGLKIVYNILEYLFKFLDTPPSEDNYVLMGYFAKLINNLLKDKPDILLGYIFTKKPEIIKKLIIHINRKSIGNIIENFIMNLNDDIFAVSNNYIIEICNSLIEGLNNNETDERGIEVICDLLINSMVTSSKNNFGLLLHSEGLIEKLQATIEKFMNEKQDDKVTYLIKLLIKINETLLKDFENKVTKNFTFDETENEIINIIRSIDRGGSAYDTLNNKSDLSGTGISVLKKNPERLIKLTEKTVDIIINDIMKEDEDKKEEIIINVFSDKKTRKFGVKSLYEWELLRTIFDLYVNFYAINEQKENIDIIIRKIAESKLFSKFIKLYFYYSMNNIFQNRVNEIVSIIINEYSPSDLVKALFEIETDFSNNFIALLVNDIRNNTKFSYEPSNNKMNSALMATNCDLLKQISNSTNPIILELLEKDKNIKFFIDHFVNKISEKFSKKLLYADLEESSSKVDFMNPLYDNFDNKPIESETKFSKHSINEEINLYFLVYDKYLKGEDYSSLLKEEDEKEEEEKKKENEEEDNLKDEKEEKEEKEEIEESPIFDARNSGVPEPEIESTNEETNEEYNDSNYWKSNLIDEELENEILKDLE